MYVEGFASSVYYLASRIKLNRGFFFSELTAIAGREVFLARSWSDFEEESTVVVVESPR